jgi:hypothetical protein
MAPRADLIIKLEKTSKSSIRCRRQRGVPGALGEGKPVRRGRGVHRQGGGDALSATNYRLWTMLGSARAMGPENTASAISIVAGG